MGQKEHKKFRKNLAFFARNFLFKSPFNVIADTTFARASHVKGVEVQVELPKYLDGRVTFLVTPCIKAEMEEFGQPVKEAFKWLGPTVDLKCPHVLDPISAPECIQAIVNEQHKSPRLHRYIVATEDEELQSSIESFPGVPLVHFDGMHLCMSDPSDTSKTYAKHDALKKQEELDYRREINSHFQQVHEGHTFDLVENLDPEPPMEFESKPKVKVLKKRKERKRAGPEPLPSKKTMVNARKSRKRFWVPLPSSLVTDFSKISRHEACPEGSEPI